MRESHRILWSRPLRPGNAWSLRPKSGSYLKSTEPRENGPAQWSVGSDNFATTHTKALPTMAAAIPGYENEHLHAFCSIGGYIVFPNAIAQTRNTDVPARQWTLNQARGCEPRISDRVDLTLEAIRLYFAGVTKRDKNPIGDVLDAYGWFFDAFGRGAEGFDAYVDYFFLNPLVSGGRVRALYGRELTFSDALPRRESDYKAYIEKQGAVVSERNEFITRWWEQNNKGSPSANQPQ
ncbi:MAG: hypothetical protein JNK40_02760 [Chromatiales bacterium]|nr:hypothetical protein [Chromatiales bacterium]